MSVVLEGSSRYSSFFSRPPPLAKSASGILHTLASWLLYHVVLEYLHDCLVTILCGDRQRGRAVRLFVHVRPRDQERSHDCLVTIMCGDKQRGLDCFLRQTKRQREAVFLSTRAPRDATRARPRRPCVARGLFSRFGVRFRSPRHRVLPSGRRPAASWAARGASATRNAKLRERIFTKSILFCQLLEKLSENSRKHFARSIFLCPVATAAPNVIAPLASPRVAAAALFLVACIACAAGGAHRAAAQTPVTIKVNTEATATDDTDTNQHYLNKLRGTPTTNRGDNNFHEASRHEAARLEEAREAARPGTPPPARRTGIFRPKSGAAGEDRSDTTTNAATPGGPRTEDRIDSNIDKHQARDGAATSADGNNTAVAPRPARLAPRPARLAPRPAHRRLAGRGTRGGRRSARRRPQHRRLQLPLQLPQRQLPQRQLSRGPLRASLHQPEADSHQLPRRRRPRTACSQWRRRPEIPRQKRSSGHQRQWQVAQPPARALHLELLHAPVGGGLYTGCIQCTHSAVRKRLISTI
jgi:hypothetical protein